MVSSPPGAIRHRLGQTLRKPCYRSATANAIPVTRSAHAATTPPGSASLLCKTQTATCCDSPRTSARAHDASSRTLAATIPIASWPAGRLGLGLVGVSGSLYGAPSTSTPVIFRIDCTRLVGKYRWVHRTVDRLLVRSRVHGTASCSRVVCTTHRSRVTQPRLVPVRVT